MDERYYVRIAEAELRHGHRRWNGNDDKGRQSHHGVVRLSESPLDVQLTWTMGAGGPVGLVGCYRLNLGTLLRDGYIREDLEPGTVRLRFARRGSGIYIQVNGGSPALRVGPAPGAAASA